jgi:hypothetical protein
MAESRKDSSWPAEQNNEQPQRVQRCKQSQPQVESKSSFLDPQQRFCVNTKD